MAWKQVALKLNNKGVNKKPWQTAHLKCTFFQVLRYIFHNNFYSNLEFCLLLLWKNWYEDLDPKVRMFLYVSESVKITLSLSPSSFNLLFFFLGKKYLQILRAHLNNNDFFFLFKQRGKNLAFHIRFFLRGVRSSPRWRLLSLTFFFHLLFILK